MNPGTLSRAEAERIAEFLTVSVEPTHADLAFVFGTRHLEPARIAADLFRRNIVDYVVLTGGRNRISGTNEALTHLDFLISQGIPADRIIVESASTTTAENVIFALPKITMRMELGAIKTIVLVAKWYHSRRAMMTLKRHLPAGIQYFCKVYEPDNITRQTWYLSAESAAPVLREWQCIPEYLKQGQLVEIIRAGNAFV